MIKYEILYEDIALPLMAKTDKTARREAKEIADANGWDDYNVGWFNTSDHCKGVL